MFGHPQEALELKRIGPSVAEAVPYIERCLACGGHWFYTTVTTSRVIANVRDRIWDSAPTEHQKAYRERQRG